MLSIEYFWLPVPRYHPETGSEKDISVTKSDGKYNEQKEASNNSNDSKP